MEDIHKGTVFVRLSIGVNAIAHSCYDSRTVGKKEEVSFVVTHIDEDRNVAVGLISRIIRQDPAGSLKNNLTLPQHFAKMKIEKGTTDRRLAQS